MKLQNPKSERIYEVKGPVYTNDVSGVWCGTVKDEALGSLFVKIQNYGNFSDKTLRESVMNTAAEEARSLKLAGNCTRGVPKLYDHWNDHDASRYVIVMQKAHGSALRSWMNRNKTNGLEAKELYVRTQIIISICEVMNDILRKYPVLVHRDLKPENIFIRFDKKRRRWRACIIDFGCANMNYIRNVGTPVYQAPEQQGKKNTSVGITTKTDIFSIGQIFYELLLGEPQLIGTSYTFRAGGKTWTRRPELTPQLLELKGGKELNDILKRMTEYKPSDRIIYDELITELKRIRFR